MTHEDIEQALGAYALHATTPEEDLELEAHLLGCPRCTAEVRAFQETAAMLGSVGGEAPAGLWDKIAGSIAEDTPGARTERPLPRLLAGPPESVPGAQRPDGTSPADGSGPRPISTSRKALAWGAVVAAVAAAAVAFLGVQVAQLHSQVGRLRDQVAVADLAAAAAAAQAGPHETVDLTSSTHSVRARVVLGPDGSAYWIWSSLAPLPASQTYQLWGLANDKPVSLGLVGPDPRMVDFFRLEPGTTEVMVTAEPRGGVPLPTTPVLAEGDLPTSFS